MYMDVDVDPIRKRTRDLHGIGVGKFELLLFKIKRESSQFGKKYLKKKKKKRKYKLKCLRLTVNGEGRTRYDFHRRRRLVTTYQLELVRAAKKR